MKKDDNRKMQDRKDKKGNRRPYRGKQGRKDSDSKRVNFDNARESKVERDIKEDSKRLEANDISWYSKNPTLLKSAASFPFASILGNKLFTRGSVPGVMVLPWTPCFGRNNVALNQAFNSMYSYVVHANSRNYNYTAPDLAVLMLAGSQVYAILGSVLRAYGAVKFYSEENKFMPDALLRAMGFNPSDFRANLPNIWFQINNFIDQLKQIWIPDVFPVIDRWYWMNTNLFTDAQGYRSQIYLFSQVLYFGFSETGVKTGSSLGVMCTDGTVKILGSSSTSNTFNPNPNSNYKWEVWAKVIQGMIDLLIQSEDRGIIYGDILKAYGAESIKALSPIDSNFVVAPAYNAEVLTQIENWVSTDAMCLGLAQNENFLYPTWQVGFSVNGQVSAPVVTEISNLIRSTVLNFHMPEQPTPEMITIATRMCALGAKGEVSYNPTGAGNMSSTTVLKPEACGTELPHDPYIIYFNDSLGLGLSVETWAQRKAQAPDAASRVVDYSQMDIMAFDWHPFMYITDGTKWTLPTSASATNAYIKDPYNAYGDFDNYTVIPADIMQKLHDTCAFSLFGVPQI